MAIDYKKEWCLLKHIYGKYIIQDKRGIPSIPTTLDEVMNFQIQHTIMAREKLMEEYVKERITTNIDGGEKSFYNVQVIDKAHGRVNWLLGSLHIHKADFATWCKKKGGK